MKVHLNQHQRWIVVLIIALATVMTAVNCSKIFGESKLASLWFIPAIGYAILGVVFGSFLASSVPADEATTRAGAISVSIGAVAVLALGSTSAALYTLDEPSNTTRGATANRNPAPIASDVPKGNMAAQGSVAGQGNAAGNGNIIGDGNVIEETHIYQNTGINPHPPCTEGAICLWPGKGFTGKMWKWTPGEDKDGPLPDYLQDHLGSFVSEAYGCFVDSDGDQAPREVKPTHHRGRYIETYGAAIDTIKARC
ncbi:peptidase inhibitor family I36 protein [Nonomuraea fastidiosa]|jgi:hypothetical protein|uniref:peptidase inhibitor family I36 protein n=1 Tax=Nonomuraea TaxID=83681 RepID=UPI00325653A4